MLHTRLISLFTAAILVFSTGVFAEVRTVSVSELEPESKHIRASELITHILTTYHYKKTELDDQLSSEIYKHYLENLDQNKAYFIKSDIQEFEPYRFKIDDAIIKSDLSPAYNIF